MLCDLSTWFVRVRFEYQFFKGHGSLDPVFDLKNLRVVTRFDYSIRLYVDDKPACLIFFFVTVIEEETVRTRETAFAGAFTVRKASYLLRIERHSSISAPVCWLNKAVPFGCVGIALSASRMFV
jgi:hypothetical protein